MAFLALVLEGVFIVLNRNSFKEAPESVIKPTERLESTQAPSKSRFETKGSIPYWDQDRAFSTFTENVRTFDYINIFWYYLGEEGTVEKYRDATEDKKIIDFARENNTKALAVVTNLSDKKGSTWDSKIVEDAIKDKTTRDKHVGNIAAKIEEFDFDGVTIDYEEVEESQKEKFSLFIENLSAVMNQNGKIVAVAIHPKTSDSSGNGAFQDWETLAKHADHLNIMVYNEHWDESKAGPIASIPWIRRVISYAKSLSVPSEKIFLGIPLYGYDWNKDDDSAAKGLTYNEVEQLLIENDEDIKWHEEFRSPYFFYKSEGDTHEVWFENAHSVAEKIRIAKKAGFAGVTFWRLGGEDQNVWEAVATE